MSDTAYATVPVSHDPWDASPPVPDINPAGGLGIQPQSFQPAGESLAQLPSLEPVAHDPFAGQVEKAAPTDYSMAGFGMLSDDTGYEGLNRLFKDTEAGPRYQTWPERLARSGFTLAHDVGTGLVPDNTGLRREDFTDIPPPSGPTKDSTWLGKKLGLSPVGWQPNDEMIERAQDMAGMAMSGPLGAGAKAGESVLGSGPMHPAPKIEPPPTLEHQQPFYSAVGKAVDESKLAKAQPSQWMGTLKNTPGVKPEELQWLGLEDWLKDQKGPVAKQDVQDFVKANQIQLNEVNKGGTNPPPEAAMERLQSWMRNNGTQTADEQHDILMNLHRGENVFESSDDLRALGAPENLVGPLVQHWTNGAQPPSPKYPTHVLPGGENYREMLLTLPPNKAAAAADQAEKLAHLATRRETTQQAINELGDEKEYLVTGAFPGVKGTRQDAEDFVNAIKKASAEPAIKEVVDRYPIGIQERPTERLRNLQRGLNKINDDITTLKRDGGVDPNQFKAGHWDEPNVLAHARFNDRTIDGQKALFLEELQSDWHQKGRRQGYQQPIPEDERPQAIERLHDLEDQLNAKYNQRDTADYAATKVEADTLRKRITGDGGVPDAPFKTTWPELALKRMIRHAAENGYDKIAWTPGDVQAARYDLSKQVKQIIVEEHSASWNVKAYDHNDNRVITKAVQTPDQLAELIGKDAADKAIEQMDSSRAAGSVVPNADLRGLDLKVGGEGMKGFYDKMLPDIANKIGKKFGAKVEQKGVPGTGEEFNRYEGPEPTNEQLAQVSEAIHAKPTDQRFVSPLTRERQMLQINRVANAQAFDKVIRRMVADHMSFKRAMAIDGHDGLADIFGGNLVKDRESKSQSVHSMDITPAMRAQAMKGFPLFSRGGRVPPHGPVKFQPIDHDPFN